MKARILEPTTAHLAKAAQALRQGELVGMPTETVYGLAGNALDETALAKIFAVKERPTFDPLIVHVAPGLSSLAALDQAGLVESARLSLSQKTQIETLISKFWPGPLTLVLPKKSRVPDLATSGLPNVAVRMPRHPVAQALIQEAGVPLAAPSANRFGRISPTTAEAVFSELGERIPLILDGGPCQVGVESTVISFAQGGAPVLLRPGGISRSEIERELGTSIWMIEKSTSNPGGQPTAQVAPGMLASHYAPRKPIWLLPRAVSELDSGQILPLLLQSGARGKSVGLMLMSGSADEAKSRFAALTGTDAVVQSLSPSGNIEEAARNLFSILRKLDDSPAEILFAEPCRESTGLGHAIQDRLRRATHRTS